MQRILWDDDHLTGFWMIQFVFNHDFSFTIDDLQHGVEWGGMVAQSLPFVKGKECHTACLTMFKFLTYDTAFRVVY